MGNDHGYYTMICVAAIIVLFMVFSCDSHGKTVCKRDAGIDGYYTWRQIDGQKCWYKGRRKIAKARLYWLEPRRALARYVPVDEPVLVPMMFAPILMGQEGIPEWLREVQP